MPNLPSAPTALVCASTALDICLLAQYTNAIKIQAKTDRGSWMYLIVCAHAKDYDQWSNELIAVETHVKVRCFMPLLDDGGRTSGKILLQPSFPGGFHPTQTWSAKKRKTISTDETIQALLDALAAKDRLIKVQATLIESLQHCLEGSAAYSGPSQAMAAPPARRPRSKTPSPAAGCTRD